MKKVLTRWMRVMVVPAVLVWSQPAASQSAPEAMISAPPAVSAPGTPVRPSFMDAVQLRQALEKEMIGFVQHNYPSRVNYVTRNLKDQDGRLQKDLSEATRFLLDFAKGPMTLEGSWKNLGGQKRYLLVNTIHGVKGFPDAIISFTTYPGLLRPFTIVEVDKDGDGKTDQKSTALCRCDTLKDWLTKNLSKTRLS